MNRTPVLLNESQGRWLGWLGHKIRYLATEEETSGRFCLSTALIQSGDGAPPHSHKFEEGFYVLSGRVEFIAGNKTVPLNTGEFIHISGGTAHAPKALEGSQLLTLAAPAGFDHFQLEAGEELPNESSEQSKSKDDVLAAIRNIAGKYGIDMNPPDDSFDVEPNIHIARTGDGDVVDAVGDRYRFLVEGEQTRGLYAMWHATITPAGGPPLHTHSREDEAFYVLKGELTFEADGQQFVGGPGSFVNLPIGSKHRFSNQTDSDVEVLIIVAPAGLEKMFRRTGNNVDDVTQPIALPNDDEKMRLVETAPEFGIELQLSPH